MKVAISNHRPSLYQDVSKFTAKGCIKGATAGAVILLCPVVLFASYAFWDAVGCVAPYEKRFIVNCTDPRYYNNSLCQSERHPAHIIACIIFTFTTVAGSLLGVICGIWNHVLDNYISPSVAQRR